MECGGRGVVLAYLDLSAVSWVWVWVVPAPAERHLSARQETA